MAQRQISETNVFVETIAGSGFYGYLDGQGTQTMFAGPEALAVDKATNVYVWDYFNARIRKIASDFTVTTFAGSGSIGSQNGQGTNASFWSISSLAVDRDGNILAGDQGSVRKVTPTGLVTTVTGDPGDLDYLNGDMGTARFGAVFFLAPDPFGNIYVADSDNNRIRKICTNGMVTTFAGSGNYGSKDGIGIFSSFQHPNYIAIDPAGNIFTADQSLIRKITPDGVVSSIAGTVQGCYCDGQGNNTGFWSIGGLAADSLGNLYVSDEFAVRKITPEVRVTTLAGQFPIDGFKDGDG